MKMKIYMYSTSAVLLLHYCFTSPTSLAVMYVQYVCISVCRVVGLLVERERARSSELSLD
jgi:hypothetical protein